MLTTLIIIRYLDWLSSHVLGECIIIRTLKDEFEHVQIYIYTLEINERSADYNCRCHWQKCRCLKKCTCWISHYREIQRDTKIGSRLPIEKLRIVYPTARADTYVKMYTQTQLYENTLTIKIIILTFTYRDMRVLFLFFSKTDNLNYRRQTAEITPGCVQEWSDSYKKKTTTCPLNKWYYLLVILSFKHFL